MRARRKIQEVLGRSLQGPDFKELWSGRGVTRVLKWMRGHNLVFLFFGPCLTSVKQIRSFVVILKDK